MTISTKRAKQRAKTIAASGGMTHQQALDSVARGEGFATWSEMLAANPEPTTSVPAAVTGIADPLDPSVLSRGADVRSAVADFVEAAILPSFDIKNASVYHHAVVKVIVGDWIASRLGASSPLGLQGDHLTVAFASLISDWMARSEAARNELIKFGGIHAASWSSLASADLIKSAKAQEMGETMIARIGLIGEGSMENILTHVAYSMSKLGTNPINLFRASHANSADRLPQDVVDEVARRMGADISLSDWQADVVERSLMKNGPGVPRGAGSDAQEAYTIVKGIYSHNASIDPSMVRRVFTVVPGEAGRPFAEIGTLPTGSSVLDRWIRDCVDKQRYGLKPFSFNPFETLTGTGPDIDALRSTAQPFVLLAPGNHDPQVIEGAIHLIADAAALRMIVGSTIAQIGVDQSAEVNLHTIHQVIASNAHRMDQAALFAALNGMSDCAGFDAAAADDRIVQLALDALAPFA